MPIKEGLKQALNLIRETSIQNNTLYHKEVPEIFDDTDIGTFASPILNPKNFNIMNEFINTLIQRIVYTQVETRLFRNPLQILEGDELPLGSIGQEIYINPIKSRKFNVNDFAGLLAKYDADVKVQYHQLNSDLQYPVTITRAKLKDAFVSWATLENFINAITQALYNGAYIDMYNLTKSLVSSAYQENQVQIEVVNALTSQEIAQQFLTKARTIYLNMMTPSSKYNAWNKVGGYGNEILTWSNPEDIIFLIRNDMASYLDVNVFASTFNIDKNTLLGNIIYVNDFDVYDTVVDDTGNKITTKVYDGSNIIGTMCDKRWFRIKSQEMTMDEFYNANNRTWQYYLNVVKMYSYSLFSNSVVFATALPQTSIKSLSFNAPEGITIEKTGEQEGLDIIVNPFTANTPKIEYTSSSDDVFTVDGDVNNDRHCTLTAVGAGTATLTATAGNVSTTVSVTVKA